MGRDLSSRVSSKRCNCLPSLYLHPVAIGNHVYRFKRTLTFASTVEDSVLIDSPVTCLFNLGLSSLPQLTQALRPYSEAVDYTGRGRNQRNQQFALYLIAKAQ